MKKKIAKMRIEMEEKVKAFKIGIEELKSLIKEPE